MALLILLMLCCLAYFLIQIIRFIKADADLTLLWAERFGHSPESKFRGSVVWVTGASSGIGEALCYQLAKLGAQLVLSSRREAELLRVKKKCIEISGLEDKDVLVVPLDLTNISAHKAATDKVVEHFGRGFFNSLRIELGCYPGITVSNICPGPVQSNIVQNAFTERSDQNFGSSADQSYKMSAERCARLTLVTAANDLNESWISDHPYLLICYIWQYAPTWAWWITGRIGQKRIENFKSGVDADSSYFSKKTS
ncbi:PREDICTED: dehydrogenase/reductase SDR family member 7 isoform X2 [Nanorana parkeri]|uniref:dehydrogenase/reductase SDR family member 7 isoform X2 n=1 Tax=Nanorana parkeri TaxID=125878 RepID=UPI000854F3D8|nr:PREDICTED: dehydrogenase/reductase SDR family member 7 isoform X2 [Nanorana parkeri]